MVGERKTFKSALTDSVTAAVALTKHQAVDFDGNLPAANAAIYGIVQADTAAGEQAPVDVMGVLIWETAGAISAKAAVATDAAGKAVAHSTGVIAGYAIDEATGTGEFIRVVVR